MIHPLELRQRLNFAPWTTLLKENRLVSFYHFLPLNTLIKEVLPICSGKIRQRVYRKISQRLTEDDLHLLVDDDLLLSTYVSKFPLNPNVISLVEQSSRLAFFLCSVENIELFFKSIPLLDSTNIMLFIELIRKLIHRLTLSQLVKLFDLCEKNEKVGQELVEEIVSVILKSRNHEEIVIYLLQRNLISFDLLMNSVYRYLAPIHCSSLQNELGNIFDNVLHYDTKLIENCPFKSSHPDPILFHLQNRPPSSNLDYFQIVNLLCTTYPISPEASSFLKERKILLAPLNLTFYREKKAIFEQIDPAFANFGNAHRFYQELLEEIYYNKINSLIRSCSNQTSIDGMTVDQLPFYELTSYRGRIYSLLRSSELEKIRDRGVRSDLSKFNRFLRPLLVEEK